MRIQFGSESLSRFVGIRSLILPQVNSGCMQIFFDEIAHRYLDDNVLDGAG